jgi:thiol-disulfide isomerase/thioredoxin
MNIQGVLPQMVRARELYGDFWFNGEPVPVTALRGQVLLLYFWDCSSASSQRILPYILEWERRYGPHGAVFVGIHTPRFVFAKSPEVVQHAINKLGIRFPVVMDNEALIAANYECWSVPEMILVDKDGFIRYRNPAEGGYAAFEHALQALLYDAGARGEQPLIMDPVRDSDRPGVVCFRATPELYGGYARGTVGNVEGVVPESVVHYTDPDFYIDGRVYLVGDWISERECIRVAGPRGSEAQMVIRYQGLEVTGVLEPADKSRAEIIVRQDDEFLQDDIRGDDVRIDKHRRSLLVISRPRLYSVVRNQEYGEHVLRISAGKYGFAAYAFSFSTAAIPELISKN